MECSQSPRNYSALRWLQAKARQSVASLPTCVASLTEWEPFRDRIRKYLRENLPLEGWGSFGPSEVIGQFPLEDDLTLEIVDVSIEKDYFMRAHLYRQTPTTAARAAVIVSHGYGQMKRDIYLSQACIDLARRGYVAFAVEHAPSGEAADRPDYETNMNNITCLGHLLGISNPAIWSLGNIRALDYLQSRRDVDPERIGIVGLCQGSIGIWSAIACDARFRVCVPFYGGTTYARVAQEYMSGLGGWSGASPYMFDILKVCDVQHLLACVAPRPMMILNNVCDIHWSLAGLRDIADFCGQVYGLYDARNRFVVHLESSEHNYVERPMRRIIEWFEQWL